MDRNEIEEWLRIQEQTVEQIRDRWAKVVADDCRSFSDLQLADEREQACKVVRHLLQAQTRHESLLCSALNTRDAYGGVVSRLIEWFHEGSVDELFEADDYAAIMMDAGLMDDDYQLTGRAKQLFKGGNLPNQFEERASATPSEQQNEGEE